MTSFDENLLSNVDISGVLSEDAEPASVHDWTLLHASKGNEAMVRPLREALANNGARMTDLLRLCARRLPAPRARTHCPLGPPLIALG